MFALFLHPKLFSLSIKKLAGQTMWYGLPSIATRFIGYILNFSLIFLYKAVNTADLTQIYAIFPFLNILFTYGVETSFFRFIQNHPKQKLFNTLNVSIFVSTILLTGIMILCKEPLVEFTAMQDHPEFITWMAIESLKRKGLVKVYYENISFGDDMGEKIIVEKIDFN